MVMIDNSKFEQQERTSIRTASEPYLYWKKHLFRIPLYFRIIAYFEADNEIVDSCIGNKTTISYKQYAICNGFF